jgi:hypothetical protein
MQEQEVLVRSRGAPNLLDWGQEVSQAGVLSQNQYTTKYVCRQIPIATQDRTQSHTKLLKLMGASGECPD